MRDSNQAMRNPVPSNDPHERADVRDGLRLLTRIARREPEALAELYRMWGDRLYSMALHWIQDEGAAK